MTASEVKRAGTRPKRRATGAPKAGAGGTLLGIFIGLGLGLALAAVVAWTLIGGRASAPPARTTEPPIATAPRDAKAAKAPVAEKDRFDFYKILPGGEEPKLAGKAPTPDRVTVTRADAARTPEKAVPAEPSTPKAAKTGDRFWLQAGSFTQESDAENLKARLALAGWEAQVQSGTLPDKGVRFRVRLGPYDHSDELNRIKGQLAQRGFEAAVIKF
ncbi:MAG: SPOR domain-containing protein [Betaproteobacteria bacterium]